MKKFFSILALALLSVTTWAAASITAPDIDFGTISIKGQTLPVSASETVTVNFSDLATEGYSMYAEISEGLLDDDTNPNGFSVSPDTKYLGYGVGSGSIEFTVSYSVKAAGTFTGKLHLYCYDTNYEEVHCYANITITVIDEAIVAKTIPFEKVTSLHVNDTIIFVNEAAGAITGKFTGDYAYIPAIKDITFTDGKANIPEDAQMFVVSQYNGKWQFTTTDTNKRLHLDVSGKGAFTYADTQAGSILAGWGVTFDASGNATVSRGDDDETFPVRYYSDRFKPLKNLNDEKDIAIYKKVGEAQKLVSSLEVEPINFGEVEQDEVKEVTVAYTATNIDGEIQWDIVGTDKELFSITPDATNGTITVKYLGTATKTGAATAQVYALFENQELDLQEEYFDINLTLIPATVKLTKIEFVDAPDSLVRGGSIDLSTFVQYTPNDAADKSLTWSVDKSYQGTVDENGVFTAYNVTGEVTITATSVRVPSVSASVTLMLYTPEPETITLDKHELTTQVGAFDTLTAIVGPNGASQKCWFTSRNTNIITCKKGNADGKGVLTIKALCPEGVWVLVNPKPGDTLYTTVVDSCLVKVVPVAVESISLPESADLKVGMSLQLDPTVTPAQAKDEYTITYVSGNEAVATVDANGKVTAVAEGTAEITATITEGKSATITITVIGAKYFEKVTNASDLGLNDTIILASQSLMMAAGAINSAKSSLDTITDGVLITDEKAACADALEFVLGGTTDAFTLQIGNSTLNSSDGSKLTTGTKNNTWSFEADANGVVVRNNSETTKAICYNGQSKLIRLYATGVSSTPLYVYVRKFIKPAVESVTLDKHELAMHVGDNDATLKVTVLPKEAEQTVEWKSLNEDVATVSSNGKVHAVAEGEAKIVVVSKANAEVADTCLVTVSEWKVESITLECDDEETIEIGETLRIFYEVQPTAHTFEVTMSSDHPEIASVENEVVTGVAEGTAVITVSAGDKSAQVTVIVIQPAQGINDVKSDTNVVKIIRDGQVLILRNGEVFTVRGERIRGLED